LNLLSHYFPELNQKQIDQFIEFEKLFKKWNSKINLISRKDIANFQIRHLIHSLSISRFIKFSPKTEILDIGTGGGFPGLPLAILFPDLKFYLIDKIGKKINVVNKISDTLELSNVEPININALEFNKKVDFVVSRAVTSMNKFVPLVENNFKTKNINKIRNGILCLKGGDLKEELKKFDNAQVYKIHTNFPESFFIGKKIVYLPF
tara:strand:+ start:52 stop:669 length:618 start_codon:yes stop_codon:yes gene_type:complete